MAALISQRQEARLLAHLVSERDVTRVTMFIRHAKDRLRFDWQVVSEGRADVLLVGQDELTTLPGTIDAPTTTMKIVDDPRATGGDPLALVRPLQYDSFVDSLMQAEGRLAKQAAPAIVVPPPVQAPSKPILAGLEAGAPKKRPHWDDASFRLKRWPSGPLLHKYRYGVRLASFLSVRQVNLPELVRLSNVDSSECLTFIEVLRDAGFLTVVPSPNAPRQGPAATGTTGSNLVAGASLVARLRRSLGITTAT